MYRVCVVLLLLVLLAAPPAAARRPAPDQAAGLAEATGAFGCDLYAVLRKTEGNLFFSPYSVIEALAMTAEGARGKTASEMSRVLHLTGSVARDHRDLAKALTPGMFRDAHDEEERPAYALNIANTVWVQEGLPIEDGFTKALAAGWSAGLRPIDFRKTALARQAINDWVAKETMDRIQDIIPEDLPTPDTLLALANAIWFKAAWKHPFKEHRTKVEAFYSPDGPYEVPMMVQTESFRYAGTDEAQVLSLPYRGREMSMVIVLPRAEDGLEALEEKLTAESLAGYLSALKPARVTVKLPKFTFTNSIDLTTVLPEMGMTDAFSAGKADFTGITEAEPLYIGAVLHKSFVAVDEAGTEAAAATVVMMLKGGRDPNPPVEFTADHPFLFLIRHEKTGAVLFMGRVIDPS